MSKMKAISPAVDVDCLLTAFTAEAWLNPALTAAFQADGAKAICEFARENGFPVPDSDAIKEFALPSNPIGDLELEISHVTMDTTADYGCSTAATGCGSNNGTCGPTPTTPGMCASISPCESAQCSFSCPTQQCTYNCTTTMCTYDCGV